MPSARLHWPAIVVASIASFLFEAAWFTVFYKQWLIGIGRTEEYLIGPAGLKPPIQFATALLCSLIAAIVLSLLTQWTGPRTAKRGMLLGIVVWVGFVATSWAKEYIFEVRSLEIYAINTVYCLIDLSLIGVIVGAWKPKSRLL